MKFADLRLLEFYDRRANGGDDDDGHDDFNGDDDGSPDGNFMLSTSELVSYLNDKRHGLGNEVLQHLSAIPNLNQKVNTAPDGVVADLDSFVDTISGIDSGINSVRLMSNQIIWYVERDE